MKPGVYREQVYCAVVGKADAPITIRAYPGERVILDGGLAEWKAAGQPVTKEEPQYAPSSFVPHLRQAAVQRLLSDRRAVVEDFSARLKGFIDEEFHLYRIRL